MHADRTRAILAVILVLPALSIVAVLQPVQARPEKSSLREAQREHDRFPENRDSRVHDTQPRVPTDTPGTDFRHRSCRAPDKTTGAVYDTRAALEKQRKTNMDGSIMGTAGWDAVHRQYAPAFPPSRLTNGHYAAAAITWSRAATAIAGSPQAQLPSAVADMHVQQQSVSDAATNATMGALDEGMKIIDKALTNIANESAGTPVNMQSAFRPLSQIVWMVQQMYRHVYMPAGLLLLLPGAVMCNAKWAAMHMLGDANDEDVAAGPFGAILHTLIAIFLIPATQLIISYSIDAGNSLTNVITEQVQTMDITRWAQSQYDSEQATTEVERARSGVPQLDPKPYKNQTFSMAVNLLNMSLANGLLILVAFQTVLMCYLMLMGPIAAALYAWPSVAAGKLFRPVFVNWVNAVISLSLWRFWWMVIVLVMVTRIQWLQQSGDYAPGTLWESLMVTCFLVMMGYVPFSPFELKPGRLVDTLLEKAKQIGDGSNKDNNQRPDALRSKNAPTTNTVAI